MRVSFILFDSKYIIFSNDDLFNSDGWSGRQCKCNLKNLASMNDNCDEEDTCNGQGTCQCGKCKCNPNFLGTHCKCSKAEVSTDK